MSKRLNLRIAHPCAERWADMRPRGEGRHCDRCEKTVVDLTRVTQARARAIFEGAGGQVCARITEDARGNAVFRAEPSRLPLFAPIALALVACAAEPKPAVAPRAQTEQPVAVEPHFDMTAASIGASLASELVMPVAPPEGSDGTPTEEQRAFTRRKQRAQRARAHVPPPGRHTMGVLLFDD